jgi:hypothetical protein
MESGRPRSSSPKPRRGRAARALRNFLALLLGASVVVVPLEIGLRLVHGSGDPGILVYPRRATPINGFQDASFPRRAPPGEFRILALGASAFVTRNFRAEFERLLTGSEWFRARNLRARVISTGVPAHMSWDSVWKYRYWYEGYDFDLVLYYHGINDVRANCYPRSVFRDDYSQMPYYAQFAPAFAWTEAHPILSRCFTATLIVKLACKARVLRAATFQRQAPYNAPADDAWLVEAAEIKTTQAFEANLESVVVLARSRRQRLLLLTYAYHLPPDYTHEAFVAKRLDYSRAPEAVPVAVWGLPACVVAGIEAHNAVTRAVASRHPDLLFFDMDKSIPKSGEFFIDICHWTDRGRERFAAGVLEALRKALSSRDSPPVGARSPWDSVQTDGNATHPYPALPPRRRANENPRTTAVTTAAATRRRRSSARSRCSRRWRS